MAFVSIKLRKRELLDPQSALKAPTFAQSEYTTHWPENMKPQTILTLRAATVGDLTPKYSIKETSSLGTFSIGVNDGHLATNRELDYEKEKVLLFIKLVPYFFDQFINSKMQEFKLIISACLSELSPQGEKLCSMVPVTGRSNLHPLQ